VTDVGSVVALWLQL